MSARTYTIHVEMSGRPDSSGIRIRSVDPIGLYCASKNREEALLKFAVGAIKLTEALGGLIPSDGECLFFLTPNWDEIFRNGTGELKIQAIHESELGTEDETIDTAIVVLQKARSPSGMPIFIVRDRLDIDRWLVEAITELQGQEKPTMQ